MKIIKTRVSPSKYSDLKMNVFFMAIAFSFLVTGGLNIFLGMKPLAVGFIGLALFVLALPVGYWLLPKMYQEDPQLEPTPGELLRSMRQTTKRTFFK